MDYYAHYAKRGYQNEDISAEGNINIPGTNREFADALRTLWKQGSLRGQLTSLWVQHAERGKQIPVGNIWLFEGVLNREARLEKGWCVIAAEVWWNKARWIKPSIWWLHNNPIRNHRNPRAIYAHNYLCNSREFILVADIISYRLPGFILHTPMLKDVAIAGDSLQTGA